MPSLLLRRATIVSPLIVVGLTSRNDANAIVAFGVDDGEHTVRCPSDQDEAILAVVVAVIQLNKGVEILACFDSCSKRTLCFLKFASALASSHSKSSLSD
jgi:hypothetical protein